MKPPVNKPTTGAMWRTTYPGTSTPPMGKTMAAADPISNQKPGMPLSEMPNFCPQQPAYNANADQG